MGTPFKMKFQIKQFGGRDDGADVLGGPVSEDNVYLTAYGAVEKGFKPHRELELGETTRMRFSLSGQKPTVYLIVRVE